MNAYSFKNISSEIEFCSSCGSILPLPTGFICSSVITCLVCSNSVNVNIFDNITSSRTIVFNLRENLIKSESKADKGPVVERKCKKCTSEQMYYFTLQTRSADEGQTVFYTCCNCGAQESEYS